MTQINMYGCLHFVPIVVYSTAASLSSTSSFFPQTENNCRGQYEPLCWIQTFSCLNSHLSFLTSILFVSMSCHIIRAFKGLLLCLVKFTVHPLYPPMFLKRSLTCCSFATYMVMSCYNHVLPESWVITLSSSVWAAFNLETVAGKWSIVCTLPWCCSLVDYWHKVSVPKNFTE